LRLLFIEPKNLPTDDPVIDELTMRMAAALRKATEPSRYFQLGFHRCVCGALSEAQDKILANDWTTNTLCVHYLAYHRSEVPEADLEMVRALPPEFELPRSWELHGAVFIDEHDNRADSYINRLRDRYDGLAP
jgi:hypothetical protein